MARVCTDGIDDRMPIPGTGGGAVLGLTDRIEEGIEMVRNEPLATAPFGR
jgi:hypothetical protein